jgi:thiol-disulfide isomerase/thioredoxin
MAEQLASKTGEVELIQNEAAASEKVKELLDSKGTVVVNIGTLECAPCRAFEPTFKEVAKNRKESFVALKLATFDEANNMAAKINEAFKTEITSYPTTLLIEDGKVVGGPVTGNMPPLLFDVVLSAKLGKQEAIMTTIATLDANKDGIVNVDEIKKVLPTPDQQALFAKLLGSSIITSVNGKPGNATAPENQEIISQFVKDKLSPAQRDAVTPNEADYTSKVDLSKNINTEAAGLIASALLPVNSKKTSKGGGR